MSKFKVGDKIRYLGGREEYCILPGSVGTVCSVVDNWDGRQAGFACIDWTPKHQIQKEYAHDSPWFSGENELEFAVSHINEQKLRKALNLS